MVIVNKTMKGLKFIVKSKNGKHKVLHKVKMNSSLNIENINFMMNEQIIRFEGESNLYDFQYDLHELYRRFYENRYLRESNKKHFFSIFQDLDRMVQFLLFVDCSNEDVFHLTFLERFSILNKLSPGLKLDHVESPNTVDLKFN